MSADIVRRFRVGKRLVEVSAPEPEVLGVVSLRCMWTPNVPKRLSRSERHQYRAGIDNAVRELSIELAERATAQNLLFEDQQTALTMAVLQ